MGALSLIVVINLLNRLEMRMVRRFGSDKRTLRDFVHRRHILSAYRDCFRLVVRIEDEEDRKYMAEWVRRTFHKQLDETDPVAKQMMRTQASIFTKEITTAMESLTPSKK